MAFNDVIKDANGKNVLVFSSLCLTKTGKIDCHTANEISLFRGGSGIYTINDVNYEFKSDDIFLIPGNVPHRGGPTPDLYHRITDKVLEDVSNFLLYGKESDMEVKKERAFSMSFH